MYGGKIRSVREWRGLTQENMATMLGIAQNTYSQYENNQVNISAKMMEKIADVLGVSVPELMSQQPAIINLQANKGSQQAIGYIETFVASQKELYEQMLAEKDKEIARLESIINKLLADNKR